MKEVNELMTSVAEAGFDGAIAIATDAEIQAGAACGQTCLSAEEAGLTQ